MSDWICDAVQHATTEWSLGDAREWNAFQKGRSRFVLGLATEATGNLANFKAVREKQSDPEELVTTLSLVGNRSPISSIVSLANNLWTSIGGSRKPDRAIAIIRAARIEFARSQLDSMLTGITLAAADKGISRVKAARIREFDLPSAALKRRWHDADSIARTPVDSDWFEQSAAYDFNDWLAWAAPRGQEASAYEVREPCSLIEPAVKPGELLAAIALVWIDEGLRVDACTPRLFALAAYAMGSASFYDGWDAHEESVRDQGRAGASIRHAQNRARRGKIIEAYKSGEFGPVKDRAADGLAKRFGVSYRTARDYLIGL